MEGKNTTQIPVDQTDTEEKLDSNGDENSTTEKPFRASKLPLNKIKSIMKMDPDVTLTSNEAVFAVTRATELFIESIAKEAYSYTVKGKRKTVTKKDFDNVIETLDCLCFLEGAMDL